MFYKKKTRVNVDPRLFRAIQREIRDQTKEPLVQTEDNDLSRTEVSKLMWAGQETVAQLLDLISRQARVEISLPASIHHALFSRLYPADAPAIEAVDVEGGPELIDTLATLSSLEPLAGAADSLRRAGYRVHVRSPGPVLTLTPPRVV